MAIWHFQKLYEVFCPLLLFSGPLLTFPKFANSITIALSHIDAIASNQAKSTFVSSISHELRSPLHGVLSASNFLKDANLSRFQSEMVEVISSCGRTLLDTINHVMDVSHSQICPGLTGVTGVRLYASGISNSSSSHTSLTHMLFSPFADHTWALAGKEALQSDSEYHVCADFYSSQRSVLWVRSMVTLHLRIQV